MASMDRLDQLQPARREFKRSLDSLAKIFDFIEAFFQSQGIDTSLRSSVDLAIDELFTNMVEHNPAQEKNITVELSPVENGISVTMTDYESTPFDIITQAPTVDIDALPEDREAGGLGLHLVKEVVDTIEYLHEDGRSRITFTKHPE